MSIRLVDGERWAELVLDRPPLNAISSGMEEELADACASVAREERWRALIVRGEGTNFSVGADIKEFLQRSSSAYTPKLGNDLQQHFSILLAGLPKPTIAAISGYCLGGGLEIALCCDLRIASEDARFGFPEVRLGLFPGMGGTQRAPRLVGIEAAKRLILGGELIDAAEALRIRLVGETSEDPRGAAVELAKTIARNGPEAVRAAKACLDFGETTKLVTGLEHEQLEWARIWRGSERVEGVSAFLEKREPGFARTGVKDPARIDG